MKNILFLLAATFSACIPANASISSESSCPESTPAELAPDKDTNLSIVLDAQGVQRYFCAGDGTWKFIAPDADLFPIKNTREQVMHHFSGATWLYKDSSSVRAARVAGVTVDPSSIQWLLLNVNHHDGKPGLMSDIVQIQRLSTVGGLAPSVPCDQAHIGEVDVNYVARYFFYRKSTADKPVRCGG